MESIGVISFISLSASYAGRRLVLSTPRSGCRPSIIGRHGIAHICIKRDFPNYTYNKTLIRADGGLVSDRMGH